MKKIYKKIINISFSLFGLIVAFSVNAQLLNNEGQNSVTNNLKDSGRGGNYNVQGGEGDFLIGDVMGTIIQAFLGLLGIIFLVMIIIGGFNWMTAAGNDDKAAKAKATLNRGVIGLIIILAAYIISAFVFRALGGIIGA